ncbi:uncharacterized protein AB675_5039 [Cyphellophora attinorum]|uniref:Asl1-like glycosyl hydrolase catalytic domain-containing protein n=1 Tax=Cyphellophora attinorum TaxID=1664694 RepID=A0A0N1HA75_9EURO|nr:uncharacterized protein AB675_5039 [Phialophora attinorum]KPI39404.1 hypothetical protein AB675_5039 [Phialophora attinorum]
MPPKPPPKPSHLTSQSNSTTTTSSPASSKRGIGIPWDTTPETLSLIFPTSTSHPPTIISWCFNWELWRPPLPSSDTHPIEWVPCIRTAAQIPDLLPFLTDISRTHKITHLLGFNEPEIPEQANLSPSDAARLWRDQVLPAAKQLGLRVGSPGMCSDPARALPWLDEWFGLLGGVEGSGVEFLVLHWYGMDLGGLKDWVGRVRERYGGLRVWVNEFACCSLGGEAVGEEEVERFVRESTAWMDGEEGVERYAYFGMGQGGTVGRWVGEGSDFVKGDGVTKVGKGYLGLR